MRGGVVGENMGEGVVGENMGEGVVWENVVQVIPFLACSFRLDSIG